MTSDSGPARSGTRLACGAVTDDLLEQVADGHAAQRTSHQAGCPHCQAALAEYDRLWAPVREAANEPVHAPESILQTALGRIRGTTDHPTYGVWDSGLGQTRIAARVVAVTARETAQGVPGVRVAVSRLAAPGSARGHEEPQVRVGVTGHSAALVLLVAATYGDDLHALADRVHVAVARQVRAVTGLEPVSITVVIDDVFATRVA